MYTIDTLLSDLDTNTNALTELLLEVDVAFFDRLPSPESWSSAQVAEHIYVLDRFIYSILNGEIETSTRPADEKVTLIQSVMNNRTRTLNAPDPIVPLGKVKDQQIIITKIITARKDIHRFIQVADLTPVCLAFTHKGFGPMTRLEWILFLIAHTQRHFHQLKNISEALQPLR
ncbi:MAG: hypothetical protein JWO58_365 [Chitinophagaceae bacterium]|nr:hypothetical protein [Chitinophagaceae bacterium]